MSKLLRYFKSGQIYFITTVTYNREPLLVDNYNLLWECISALNRILHFDVITWIILPDHFHMIIDPEEEDLSGVLKRIKLKFSYKFRKKRTLYRKTLWQHRYWDHIIRDQNDMNNHIDYIHYNPVKHGYVRSPFDWEYSSIHDFYDKGFYQCDWGVNKELMFEGEYGE